MMSTNEAPAIPYSFERLTWTEMCQRYPDEWVVMAEIEGDNDTDLDFGSALVLGHYKGRKEASPHIKAAFERHEDVSCFWTGKIRGPIPRFIIP